MSERRFIVMTATGGLGESAGGMDYQAVGQAVVRFGKRLEREPRLRKTIATIQNEMSNIEM